MHLAGSRRWARRSRSATATSRRTPIGCTAPTSRSSSPASAPPRTSSRRRCTPRARRVIDNAAREPEIGDLCAMLVVDGRRHRGRRLVDAGHPRRRAGRAARRPITRSSPTASRRPRTSPRSRSPAARSCCAAPGPTTWRCCCAASRDMGLDDHRPGRRAGRVGRDERLRVDRRGHAAVPGHRHRLQAADRHDAVGRRRRRHRHREPVPGPVPLRRGAAAARRRHPHRRPPRRRARRRPRSAARPCGPPTSAPARRWWSPAWPPTARRSSPACTTSTAATTTSSAGSVGLGADIERVGVASR